METNREHGNGNDRRTELVELWIKSPNEGKILDRFETKEEAEEFVKHLSAPVGCRYEIILPSQGL